MTNTLYINAQKFSKIVPPSLEMLLMPMYGGPFHCLNRYRPCIEVAIETGFALFSTVLCPLLAKKKNVLHFYEPLF